MIEVELWRGAGLVTCLADDRAQEAVLAERARCWSAVDARVANIELRRQLDEAINGIASGSEPPGGGK